ncbi:MAG: hypothetical protein WCX88_02850 [Patescibacteria group bacterium]
MFKNLSKKKIIVVAFLALFFVMPMVVNAGSSFWGDNASKMVFSNDDLKVIYGENKMEVIHKKDIATPNNKGGKKYTFCNIVDWWLTRSPGFGISIAFIIYSIKFILNIKNWFKFRSKNGKYVAKRDAYNPNTIYILNKKTEEYHHITDLYTLTRLGYLSPYKPKPKDDWPNIEEGSENKKGNYKFEGHQKYVLDSYLIDTKKLNDKKRQSITIYNLTFDSTKITG